MAGLEYAESEFFSRRRRVTTVQASEDAPGRGESEEELDAAAIVELNEIRGNRRSESTTRVAVVPGRVSPASGLAKHLR